MNIRFSVFSAKLASPALVVASVVLAVSGPVATANAQFSLQTSLEQYKQRLTTAIDSSVTKLQQTANQLNLSVAVTATKDGVTVNSSGPTGTASSTVTKDSATGQVSGTDGSAASGSVGTNGAQGTVTDSKGTTSTGNVSSTGDVAINTSGRTFTGSLSVPSDLIKKLQESNQRAIDKLNDLKADVLETASVQDLQAKAAEFDQQFKEIATANVQAAVTKSIDSMTLVLDRLQVASDSLQSQVTLLKECIQKISGTATGSASSTGVTGSANVSVPTCADLNVDINSGDGGASLQEKLSEIKSSLETIKSFLSSSITLVTQLKEGNYSGTIKSFQGISGQLDIVANLSSGVQNDLLNLSAAVNK